jgi:hypothetical protein
LQEEARRALQGLFKGKTDTLAAYDNTDAGIGGGKSGGGKKGTGGGGGGGSGGKRWQLPDWSEWSRSFSSRAASGLKLFLAFVGFIGAQILDQMGYIPANQICFDLVTYRFCTF